MNPSTIESAYPAGDPEASYLVEAARRIENILGGKTIDPGLARALCFFLTAREVRFKDGFIINELRDFRRIIGNREAELVLCALTGVLPRGWKREGADDDAVYRGLVELFERHATVDQVV